MGATANALITALGTIFAAVISHWLGRQRGQLDWRTWKLRLPAVAAGAIIVLVAFSAYNQGALVNRLEAARIPRLQTEVVDDQHAIAQLVAQLERVAKDDIAHGGDPGQITITIPAPPP